MNKRSDGESKEVKGSIKEAIGKIIGSPEIENVGSAEKSKGRKEAAQGLRNAARDSAIDKAGLGADKPAK